MVNILIDNAKDLDVTLQVMDSQGIETLIFILSKGLWKEFVKALGIWGADLRAKKPVSKLQRHFRNT